MTVLLTLGRLPKGLEVARALASNGCRVLVADPFRNHLCKPSRSVSKSFQVCAPNKDASKFAQDLVEIVERENVDLIVPISEEGLHVLQIADQFPENVVIHGASFELVSKLHDKLQFIQFADTLGLDVPVTFSADEAAAAKLVNETRCIVKPRHSASGIGFVALEKNESIPDFPDEIVSGWLVQEKLDGRLVSTFSICHHGVVLETVLYEADVLTGTVAVGFRRLEDIAAVNEWIEGFANATGYDGFLSFDMIIDANGVARPIECNPRLTSGVHFLEASGLAEAILRPEAGLVLNFKVHERMQQGYSVLTEAYAHFLRPRVFAQAIRQMTKARDVVWDASDPAPFLLMTPMCWDLLRPTIFSRITLAEAAMRDIAWFGRSQTMPKRFANLRS